MLDVSSGGARRLFAPGPGYLCQSTSRAATPADRLNLAVAVIDCYPRSGLQVPERDSGIREAILLAGDRVSKIREGFGQRQRRQKGRTAGGEATRDQTRHYDEYNYDDTREP